MRVLLLLLVAVLLVGCQQKFEPNPTHGEPLAFGMKSHYLRPNLVAAWGKKYRTEVVVDRTLASGAALHAVRVLRSQKTHPGDIVLAFLDDGLMQVCFFPDDFEAYVADGKAKRDPAASRRVEVRTATDRRGKRYVAWSDAWLVAKRGEPLDPCEGAAD
jgi:hypothetical protein